LVVKTIFNIIRDINREGVTIFLVEQNARMALNLAHRAYVLQTGQVVMSDEAKKLAENPEVQKAYLGG
jgi:branched-chain amino acid transport system ATP-binding protein